MLTSCFHRHEGGIRYRSLDLQEAAAFARYTTLQDGAKGTFVFFPVLYCAFDTAAHVSTHPFPFRAPFLARNAGEAGRRAGMLHATNALHFVPRKATTCLGLAFDFLHSGAR